MCQVELRGGRRLGMIFTAAERTVPECTLACSNTNRGRIELTNRLQAKT